MLTIESQIGLVSKSFQFLSAQQHQEPANKKQLKSRNILIKYATGLISMPKRQDYPEKNAALVSELIAALRLTYLTKDCPKVSCVGFLRVTF